jgi:hypothetical protein
MITATNQATSAEVNEVFRVTSSLVELTPRRLDTLQKLAREGRLVLIHSEGELAGWAAVERLTRNLSELGMVYIKPEHRSAKAFDTLIKEIARRPERMLLATYSSVIMRYAGKVWKSHEITLAKAIWISRGRFLTKRLNPESRESIQGRMTSATPRYALIERQ